MNHPSFATRHGHIDRAMTSVNLTLASKVGVVTAAEDIDYVLIAYLQAAFVSVIFVTSFIGNLTVFLVFYRKPSLLTLSNRLVLNLCVCNFLLTVLVLPPNAVASAVREWPLSAGMCVGVAFVTSCMFATCVFTLLAISVDRYYAIIRPLHYRMHVTSRRLTALLVALWVVAAALASQPLFRVGRPGALYRSEWGLCTCDWRSDHPADRAYAYVYLTTCFLAPLAGMCWCYIRIFRAAQTTSARARRNSADVGIIHGVAAMTGSGLPARRQSAVSLLHTRRSSASGLARGLLMLHKDDQKAAATGMIVMSTFLVCWLPMFALIAYEASPAHFKVAPPRYLGNVAAWTAFCGCALNPFVYVFRSRAIGKECRRLLTCVTPGGHYVSGHRKRSAPPTGSWPPSAAGSRAGNSDVERVSPPNGPLLASCSSAGTLPISKLPPLRENDIVSCATDYCGGKQASNTVVVFI